MDARRVAIVAAAMLAGPSGGVRAQAPDACGLIGREEFQALTGRAEYTDPEGMPWGGGTVCGFNNGQVLLFTGEDSRAAFDRLLADFGQQDLPRESVEGLGEGAFAFAFDPEDNDQDHGTFVVFGAGPATVAVTVYSEEGEKGETALPKAMAVAQAVAARLP